MTSTSGKTTLLRSGVLAAAGLLLGLSCTAQTLVSLSADSRQAEAGKAVQIKLELKASDSAPKCGLTIDFGNNDVRDIKVGQNGDKDLVQTFEQTYAQAGLYTVTVKGKRINRGLNSMSACDGRVSPMTLQVTEHKG